MLDKCGSVEACAQEVATRMNEGEKIMAYSLAWEICAADYVIHKSEKIFLDHLKTTCNVSEQIAEAVRVSICARCPNLPGV
jgi:nicotinate-nucleotide pyrophosphorylase